MRSHNVRIWEIRANKGKRKSYTVRWVVAGRERSQNFATRALADSFRSGLIQAVHRGEAFDTVTGLPESMTSPPASRSWLSFVSAYVAMKWPGAAAKSRDAMTDALATASAGLVRDMPARPDAQLLRSALRQMLLPERHRGRDINEAVMAAWRWLERASVPLTDLLQPMVIRSALDALALTLDGTPAAATTMRRKRAVLYNALQYAVELEELRYNPVDKVRVRSRRTKVVGTVDRRVVVNPDQAHDLIEAVGRVGKRGRGERLVAFFACLYFAALRPGEALALRVQDCDLPETGWGRLTLEKSRPQASKRWTDSGQAHDERGLKHRGEEEPRVVPIPPELVVILRAHLKRFGAGPGGLLFRSPNGNPVSASTYGRVWEAARRLVLTPAQVASPLAGCPYDLRHAAVSLWLNAGVPAPEVAERAGHSVDVLLRVYAKCIDGQEASVNARIEAALGGNQ